jgi:hypothetical protein
MASLYCTLQQNRSMHKVYCEKCNDKFVLTYGNKSERNSCRYHNHIVNQLGQLKCTDCDLIGNQCSKNCYHVQRPKSQCVIL